MHTEAKGDSLSLSLSTLQAQQPPSLLAHQPAVGARPAEHEFLVGGASTAPVAGFFGPGTDGAADYEGGSDEGSLALGLTLSFGSTAGAPSGVHSSRRTRAPPPLPPPSPAPPPHCLLWGDYGGARPSTAPTAADRAAAAAAASAAIHARRALLTGFDSVPRGQPGRARVPRGVSRGGGGGGGGGAGLGAAAPPALSALHLGTIGRPCAPLPPSVPLSMDALLWCYPSKSARRPPQPEPPAGEILPPRAAHDGGQVAVVAAQ